MTASHVHQQSERSSRLDRDRIASLADEGGASAARFEARDIGPAEPASEDNKMRQLAALLILGALVLWILFLNR